MFGSDEPIKEKITALIKSGKNDTILGKKITESLTYEDLAQDEPNARANALFTILLHAGYLTATNIVRTGVNYLCDLSIPNHEVRLNYEEIFSDWLKTKIGHLYSDISGHLLRGDIPQFTHEFRQALLRVFSFRDLNKEIDYQLILGTILAGALRTHIVESNRETRDGYPDFVVIPREGFGTQGIVIELKRPSRKKKEKARSFAARKELLEELVVVEGLKQIEERYRNDAFQNYQHVTTVLRLGIACCSKQVVCAYYRVQNDFSSAAQIDDANPAEIRYSYGLGSEQEFDEDEQESALKKQKHEGDNEEGSNLDEYKPEDDPVDEDERLLEEELVGGKTKRQGTPLVELGFLGRRSRKEARHEDEDEDEDENEKDDDEEESSSWSLSNASFEYSDQ